jgi:hypothetical protein
MRQPSRLWVGGWEGGCCTLTTGQSSQFSVHLTVRSTVFTSLYVLLNNSRAVAQVSLYLTPNVYSLRICSSFLMAVAFWRICPGICVGRATTHSTDAPCRSLTGALSCGAMWLEVRLKVA